MVVVMTFGGGFDG